MFLICKTEIVIPTWSFHRSVKRIRWKQGYGSVLETNSLPRYEGVPAVTVFSKAPFV